MPINLRLEYLTKTTKLFWNTLLAAGIMFFGGVLLLNYQGPEGDVVSLFTHLMYWGVLLLPVSFLLAVWGKEKEWKKQWVWGGHAALILATLIVTILILPDSFTREPKEWELYSIVFLPLVLYASIYTFLPVNWFKNSTWWAYLRQFSDAASYASVIFLGLFIGITLALAAMVGLLRLSLSPGGTASIYLFLFCGIYIPLFLTQVTHRIHEERGRDVADISPLTKGLVKFLLLPLVVIYDLIVYLYLIQVTINSELPSNTLVPLILLFVAPTYLATIMIFPRLVEYGGKVRLVFRAMHLSLVPVMLFYFYAIGIRISEFGLTPDRVLILVLGAWIILTSVYFAVGIGKFFSLGLALNGLLLITLVAVYMPVLNIFTISSLDQNARVIRTLTNAGIIKGGKVNNEAKKFKFEEYNKVQNSVYYLYNTGNEWALKPYLTQAEYDVLVSQKTIFSFFDTFAGYGNFTYEFGNRFDDEPSVTPQAPVSVRIGIYPETAQALSRLNTPLNVGDFNYIVLPNTSSRKEELVADKPTYMVSYTNVGKQETLDIGPQLYTAVKHAFDLKSTAFSVDVPNRLMDFTIAKDGKTYRVLINSIGGEKVSTKYFVNNVSVYVLGQ